MSEVVHDYSGIASLVPVNWEADDDAFRYLLDGAIGRIQDALTSEGIGLDAPNLSALSDAAWSYKRRVES